MHLFVNATDINHHQLGIVSEAQFLVLETTNEPPEHLMSSIMTLLGAQNAVPKDVKRITVVCGPGSFTAVRAAASIANSFAFAHDCGLYSIENKEGLQAEDMLANIASAQKVKTIVPCYGREPNITK